MGLTLIIRASIIRRHNTMAVEGFQNDTWHLQNFSQTRNYYYDKNGSFRWIIVLISRKVSYNIFKVKKNAKSTHVIYLICNKVSILLKYMC
jgi:hypothetical protein